jgi:hypothetical protein
LRGGCPEPISAKPVRCRPKSLKINILYSMSRRAACQARSQNARGECPQLFHRKTCLLSPEVAENQYFISDVAAGHLPSPRPNLAGGCPKPTSAKPARFRQKPLKTNILYPVSRRAVFVFLVGANAGTPVSPARAPGCGLAGGRGWQECVVSTFFIFEAAHGGPKLATFWHPATSLPTSTDKSNPLKTGILYPMSRRVICPAQGQISRAAAPNRPPPSLPVFAKNC